MKKYLLFVLLSLFIFSCSKNSEQLNIVKIDTEKSLSEIEKKDIIYSCFEMSDRQAYEEIIDLNRKKLEIAIKELDDFQKEYKLGKYRTVSLDDMSDSEIKHYLRMFDFGKSYSDRVKRYSNLYNNDLKEFSKLNGKDTFYKVEVVKLNPDTIIHRKVYLDNNSKIIYSKAIK
ncbi:hypothetical protein EKL32_26955 [Flavobacterium sp. GSN2]|nr:hypothetical protein EKL32_26955 [Flavobacterium sp. GSN2]